jgi:glycosyltransferase involved in cell wall biosynthesis
MHRDMKIGLIGPVYPFRGGIAQYVTMLYRTLSLQSDVISLSFKRQYPKWLYPGEKNIDADYARHMETGVSYSIDSLNPLTWLKASQYLMSHSVSVILIPWWTVYWAPCFGFIAGYFSRRNIKVIFLCHNIVEHEPARWKTVISRRVLSKGDMFVVHTRSDAERLRNLMPKASIVLHPHPIYRQFPMPKKKLVRRAHLELLFYGFIRQYKGVDVLIKAMKLLENEDVFLTIAGEWWGKRGTLWKMMKKAKLNDKIEIIDRYISEEETAELFFRADVTVLPYRSSSGTGVVSLAYRYGKPVIVTAVGGLPEVVSDGVSGYVVKPEDPYALAEAVHKFLHNSSANMKEGVEMVARNMTWDSLADSILDSLNTGCTIENRKSQ